MGHAIYQFINIAIYQLLSLLLLLLLLLLCLLLLLLLLLSLLLSLLLEVLLERRVMAGSKTSNENVIFSVVYLFIFSFVDLE